jgi:hypothetical protein
MSVSSWPVSTSTGISGCFQPGQAKVMLGPTPLVPPPPHSRYVQNVDLCLSYTSTVHTFADRKQDFKECFCIYVLLQEFIILAFSQTFLQSTNCLRNWPINPQNYDHLMTLSQCLALWGYNKPQ